MRVKHNVRSTMFSYNGGTTTRPAMAVTVLLYVWITFKLLQWQWLHPQINGLWSFGLGLGKEYVLIWDQFHDLRDQSH